jgi:hypothetical protein
MFYGDSSLPSASRTQLIYPTSDISQPSAVWRSMAVRRPANLATFNPAITVNATIVISVSPLAYDAMTTTFASNHGPVPVTVHSGPLSLPARAQPPAWPAPWEVLPFGTPFAFQQANGASLVIDVHQSRNPGPVWHVEVMWPDLGTQQNNQTSSLPNCRFSNGSYNTFIVYTLPTLGNPWRVSYQPLPPNRVGVGVLGTQGMGGTWGGLRLPIDLTPLGAPGCTWNVSVDVIVPLTNSGSSLYTWPDLLIPSDTALAGQTFYEQAFLVDPGANALGLATTWSSKWTIGVHPGVAAAFLENPVYSASNPTGRLRGRTGVSIQLNP